MDETYDLQALIDRLAAGWRLLAATALAAALAALALAALDANRFRAEALLAVARPAEISFDPRFGDPGTDNGFPAQVGSLRTYPELATSDGLAQAVRDALPDDFAPDEDLNDLRRRIEVSAKAEGTLIEIVARAESPEAAALLANTWSEVVTARALALFGASEDADALIAAREAASAEIEQAALDLADFDSRGEASRADAQVEAWQKALRARLDGLARLETVTSDIAGLRAGLEVGPGSTLAAQLSLLQLSLASSSTAEGRADLPELSLPAGGLGAPIDVAALDVLEARVASQGTDLERLADEQAAALAEARAAQTLAYAERKRLDRGRQLAEERYMTLARKADELSVEAAATRPELRLASPAAPSDRLPLGDWLRQMLVAGLFGLLLAAGWLLWRPAVAA